MLLVAMSTNSIFCSEKNDGDDFEFIDKSKTPDPIFDILEEGDAKKLHAYLTKNPAAINVRTPYTTNKNMTTSYKKGAREITAIHDGILPFHSALARNNIPCLEVLLNHTGQYSTTNLQEYHTTINAEIGFQEDDWHWNRPFLCVALHLQKEYNHLFSQLTHISSQEEKNTALNEAIDSVHGFGSDYVRQLRCDSKIPLLLEKGADINNTWCNGTTMLHRAFRDGHLRTALEILKKYKADMTCKDDDGQTPFDYYEQNKTQLYKQIKCHGTTAQEVDNQIKQKYAKQMSAKQQQK